ncbi:MAG: hypothetical protein C0593_02705 [Marinilabiliales bacterium]|nr:MAG: hypothetical protein C0593_02705 [Marinilabiliales bacterium]
MKNTIKSALLAKRAEIESECFCKIAIKGGYENHIRDILYEGLEAVGEKDLDTEVNFTKGTRNRIDLVSGRKHNLKFLIELGHNGTWQNPFNVVNHAIDDINRAIDFKIKTKGIYTVSLLTNITEINEKETYRFRKSYLKGIIENSISNPTNLDKTIAFFKALDPDVMHFKMITAWNGFKAEIHFFICGSFDKEIEKDDILGK